MCVDDGVATAASRNGAIPKFQACGSIIVFDIIPERSGSRIIA